MRSFLAIADLFSKNILCDLDRSVNDQLVCYLEKKSRWLLSAILLSSNMSLLLLMRHLISFDYCLFTFCHN